MSEGLILGALAVVTALASGGGSSAEWKDCVSEKFVRELDSIKSDAEFQADRKMREIEAIVGEVDKKYQDAPQKLTKEFEQFNSFLSNLYDQVQRV